jgi:hypothetical protein
MEALAKQATADLARIATILFYLKLAPIGNPACPHSVKAAFRSIVELGCE